MTGGRLHGRVGLVTGSARGIGYEIAAALGAAGARVTLLDLQSDLVQAAADRLALSGMDVLGLAADVAVRDQVLEAVRTVLDRWGRIDILINNAGICPLTPFEAVTEAEWDRVLGVNLKGVFLCSQAVAPSMRRQHRGKIINIASSAGQMGGLAVGAHYSASKAGILGLTKSLARILAPDIRVNAVAPGTTESELTRHWSQTALEAIVRQIPLQRLGQPADVAGAVVFLASDEADFITGQTLSVNGGLFMA